MFAPQMTQPPYKASPKAPALFVKTANTWSPSGAAVPVPARVPQVDVGATIAMGNSAQPPASDVRSLNLL